MPFLDDEKLKDGILNRLEVYPETELSRIVKYIVTGGVIITLSLLLYFSHKNKIDFDIEMKTTREREYKLLNKKAIEGKAWIKTSEYEKKNVDF